MFHIFRKKAQKEKISTSSNQECFDDIRPVADYFYQETGITFEQQMSILQSKVSTFCRQRKLISFEELLQNIKRDFSLKQGLIDALTTNETFFYREVKQIEKLVKLIQEQNTDNVKILCAPCATGEEPYSLAIALVEAGVRQASFHIMGIDINAEAIDKAREAIYKERNIRNLSPKILEKYFRVVDEKYMLQADIKNLVSFQVENIFDTSFENLGKFDFIFSRNMLIYFDKETKQKAKNILESMRKNDKYDVFFGHADLF